MRNGVTSDPCAFASFLWTAVIHMMSSAAMIPNATTDHPSLSLIILNYRKSTGRSEGRFADRPSPDERPQRCRQTHGRKYRRCQRASAMMLSIFERDHAVGKGRVHAS